METTPALSCKTELTDRTLWYDGVSSFKSSDIFNLLGRYDIKYVDTLTQDIVRYNRSVGASERLRVKLDIAPFDHEWNIPTAYKNLNLVNYFSQAHAILVEGMDPDEIDARELRLVQEIKRYQQLHLDDVLKAVIYIVHELTKNDVVWGIGRGSGTSSYVLYIIGVHDVDSFAYDLDVDDFLRD